MNITKRKPFTPGEILLEEFMQPYGLTQEKLARLIAVERRRVNEIINGKRSITPDTAIRLGKLFNMSSEYWLNLQMKNDLWNERQKKKIMRIHPLNYMEGHS
ncbi:MAG: HigA family addiction module antidote protein [Gammaproteobacteria bacterium]|nr:HigA family addiction module antidote protein [Gammaproteobacteria bacterium]